MRNSTKIREYLQKHKMNAVWRRILVGAASVVVFVTTYMLILPAITVENATNHYYSVMNSVSGNSVSGNSVSMGDLPTGLECKQDWEQITDRVKLTGDAASDVLAIAKSQLGYTENTDYYYVEQDGTLRGYTRYGEWYGEPYREWSALFASFSLHYAGVSEDAVPRSADCSEWITALSEAACGRFRGAAEYTPYSGDLLFLDMNGDGTADSVAIVDTVVADENGEAALVQVIQGDVENRVQQCTYDLQDERILGFGQMAEQGAYYEKSFTDGSVIITARYTKDAQIPTEAQLQAYRVTRESAPERYEQRQQELQALAQELQTEDVQKPANGEQDGAEQEYLIYNIGFYVGEQEIEPADTVNVTIQFLSKEGFAVGDPIAIVHFAKTGTETMTGMELTQGENGELTTSFDTAEFSDFGIMPLALGDEALQTVTVTEVSNATNTGLNDYLRDTAFSGTIILEADMEIDNSGGMAPAIYGDRAVKIDLNGHDITVKQTFVSVGGTANVILTDSGATEESVQEAVGKPLYGNQAVYDAGTQTLVYYTTDVISTDPDTGATVEKVYEHRVTGAGVITATADDNVQRDAAIYLYRGATFTMESGMIANSAHRAIFIEGAVEDLHATANLQGGYICGNNIGHAGNVEGNTVGNVEGGGVRAEEKGVINLSGTVIAGNEAFYGGGISVVSDASLNVTGGVVTGNVANGRGGGLDAWNANITVSAADPDNPPYITNNISRETGNYYSGGGGVIIRGDSSKLIFRDGYITGNYAASGAGVYVDNGGGNKVFVMSDGYISSNYATEGEGGGIRLDMNGVGRITGGHITNNITATTEHWGGGGLFIADGASCQLMSVLITDNDAGGYGGGVAGCSTGRIYISAIRYEEEGSAIFANSAAGANMSGTGSAKQEDHIYAQSNKVFTESGYQDYFCMLYSNVYDGMLGGGSENWSGSIDGAAVTIPAGSNMIGNSATGLTANPTEAHRQAAMAATSAQSGVYINGNTSNTHGGGILCNGYMVLGAVDEENGTELKLGTRTELFATKEYYDLNTNTKISPMVDKQFTFVLTEELTEKEVARAMNDSSGTLIFDKRLTFDNPGTYRYILTELPGEAGIITDETRYRITVQMGQRVETGYVPVALDDGTINQQIVNKTICHIEGITVEKITAGDSATVIRTISAAEAQAREEGHAVEVSLVGEATPSTFVNYKQTQTSISAIKEWAATTPEAEKQPVTVTLYQNDVAYAPSGQSASVILNASGTPETSWRHTWTSLPIVDAHGEYYTYSVKESAVTDYLAEYQYSSNADSEAYWIPATSLEAGNQYMIVSPDGNYALSVTEAHRDTSFDASDRVDLTGKQQSGTLNLGNATYTQWYNVADITDIKAIFIAQAHKDRILLKNSGYDSTWLVVYSAEAWGSVFGNVYEPSFFEYTPGVGLQGRQGGNMEDGTLRTIVYDGTQFHVTAGQPAAQLYQLVRTVSGGATQVTITNTPVEDAEFSLELTKVSKKDNSILLEGAEFEIYPADGIPLQFVVKPNGDYKLYEDGVDAGPPVAKVVSDENGEIRVVGMKAGTYTLEEVKAPEGYLVATPILFTLDEETPNGTWSKVIEDAVSEFVLPETGGIGNRWYTMAGLLLMSGAVYLLYKTNKSRKDEEHETI